jgi:hypothetical protein
LLSVYTFTQAVFLQSFTGSLPRALVELAPINNSMKNVISEGFMAVTINVEGTQNLACDANCG